MFFDQELIDLSKSEVAYQSQNVGWRRLRPSWSFDLFLVFLILHLFKFFIKYSPAPDIIFWSSCSTSHSYNELSSGSRITLISYSHMPRRMYLWSIWAWASSCVYARLCQSWSWAPVSSIGFFAIYLDRSFLQSQILLSQLAPVYSILKSTEWE